MIAITGTSSLYIARNQLVEEALNEATVGNLIPFERLMTVLTRPFVAIDGMDQYTQPAPATFGEYRTYCGT